MPVALNLIGQRYGRLTVIMRASGRSRWQCSCDCGNIVIVTTKSVRRGHRISCGCAHRDALVNRNFKHGASTGGKLTPTYSSWAAAKARCYKTGNIQYKNYGGRGIKMCDRWHYDYSAFLADMGEKPAGHSLDRIDPNGDYEPSNCRWATASVQAKNKREYLRDNSRFLTIRGRTQTVPQWSRESGVQVNRIFSRLLRGWPDHAAVFEPPRKGRKFTHSSDESRVSLEQE